MTETTAGPIVQTGKCGGCGNSCSFTWPAGLAPGKYTEHTMCPCGRGRAWNLTVQL